METWAPLKKLKSLDLHGNQIKDLKKNQFKGLRDVEALDLSHNMIDKLDSSHLGDLTKMGFCNLSHNAIPELKRFVNKLCFKVYVAETIDMLFQNHYFLQRYICKEFIAKSA